jgi:hypothetical protein
VLYDAGGRDPRPPHIDMFDDKTCQGHPVHTINLEHLKFSDKSFRQRDPTFMLSVKKEKHHFEFDSLDTKDEWVQGLCHISPDLWKQRASSLDISDTDDQEEESDMRENLLYDSYEKGILIISTFFFLLPFHLGTYCSVDTLCVTNLAKGP